MQTEIEEAFQNSEMFQCFAAEPRIQALMMGKYVDSAEVRNSRLNARLKETVAERCRQFGIL